MGKKDKELVQFEYGEDAGSGYENQTSADSVIPFLAILQPLSPKVMDEASEAKAGMIYNTVTEQLWDRDKGVLFVAATTRHLFSEWQPREQGGGFCGHHEIDSEVVQKAIKSAVKFGKNSTEEGNDLVETFYVYGAIADEEGNAESMAVMAFKSTHIRAYKTWMTRLRQMTLTDGNGARVMPPLYAHLSRITSVMRQNDSGTFFVPVINSADPRGVHHSLIEPNDSRFQMAKTCRQLLAAGDGQIKPEQQQEAVGSDGTPF